MYYAVCNMNLAQGTTSLGNSKSRNVFSKARNLSRLLFLKLCVGHAPLMVHKFKTNFGDRKSSGGKLLALHGVESGSIPGTVLVLQALLEMIL